jgi:hypothetical protein
MFSCAAKLLEYFANGPAKDVADLRSEILGVPAGRTIVQLNVLISGGVDDHF